MNREDYTIFDFENNDDTKILHKVLSDFDRAEKSRQPREDAWRRWYKLYRSYVDEKEKLQRPHRSNLFIPYVFSIVETVVPRLISNVFASRPYIGVLPVNEFSVEKAKAHENLLDYQLNQKIGIVSLAVSWFKEALLYGTSILKVGWEYEEGEVWTEKPSLEVFGVPIGTQRVKETQVIKDDPLVEHIDLWDFYIDPEATDIDDARYCIHRVYRDLEHLRRMEEIGIYSNIDKVVKSFSDQSYDIGVAQRLSDIGMQSNDGQSGKIELLEYWRDDRVVVVANRAVVIRNEENPYYHRKKPFVRLVDTLVPHEFYGIGEIEPLEHLQYELNSLRNQRMDNINIIINKMWKIQRGADIDPKQLQSRPGGIIEVDEMDDVQELEMDDVTGNIVENVIEMIRRDMDNAVGVYDYARGETTDRRETATTASILSTAANERFKLKITIIEDLGLRRLGQLLIQNNQQFITTERAIRILGKDGFQIITIRPEDIRGQFDVMPLGSSIEPVVNKNNRLQNFINLYNVLSQSPYINHPELIKRILEAADIKDIQSIILPDAQQLLLQQLLGNMEQQGSVPVPNDRLRNEYGVMENAEV